MTATTVATVRETIERPLDDEPQSVVRVFETAKLRTDLVEYVLTDQLARDFARVLDRVIEASGPAGGGTDRIGIWVSGFYGSGKSHFAKLAGHLLADTAVGGDSARGLFQQLLHAGRPSDERLRALFHQAKALQLECHLVPFDITGLHAPLSDRNVGFTFMRAFYQSLKLSSVFAFAQRELELQAAGKYPAFLQAFKRIAGVPWEEEKDYTSASAHVARCLAEVQPERYPSVDLASHSLQLAMDSVEQMLSVDGVVDELLRWLDGRQKQAGPESVRLVFVADEVGGWAAGNQDRIEQVRSLVETLASKGQGRVWLIATSQEKLSDVVQNAPIANTQSMTFLLQRLEARFQTNVHLESSEVGSVIEERVLRKRPSARAALEQLWKESEQQLRDVAEPPGLELGANYPRAERDHFVNDYPFLPYQVQAAADIFGAMRGVKVSSGARSMIKVVFDATRTLADRELGVVVSWDQVFDSANRENEFQDEQYLGSQGLTYLHSADQHVADAPIARPSRLLKTLWLAQQSARIPRTPPNLARLLVDDLKADVLQLEQDVEQTLKALEERSYVRQETDTGQWRFLTQDEVTVERIVRRIAGEIKQKEVREEVFTLYRQRLERLLGGSITMGKSNTSFKYLLSLNGVPLKNESAAVKLRVDLVGGAAEGKKIAEESATYLEAPEVRWVLEQSARLEERLRRAMAVERVETDEEYRRVATARTRGEAVKLQGEALELRRNAGQDVDRALEGGTIHWGGQTETLASAAPGPKGSQTPAARTKVEQALRDRIATHYHRFSDGDRVFNAGNVDKLFNVPASERAGLDPGLGLFGPEGHVHGNHVLVEALAGYLKASTRTSGQDVSDHFGDVPYGWAPDLLRYAAAAMFVDGKVSAQDRSGKRYDNPRESGARTLFGTAPFKTTRFEVEEESLTPEESGQARALLTDLGQPPEDGGEVALKEATLRLTASLSRRLAILDKAREVQLPLPDGYDGFTTTLDALQESASRVKVVRALLASGPKLREMAAALKRLEEFQAHSGFAQYRRSQELLAAALQAGLADDPTHGATIQVARDELEALKQQARVLDEWESGYRAYRLEVLDTFRAVYAPLRDELHRRSSEAAQAVQQMAEYQELSISDRTTVRVEYLSEGRPLCPVPLPELRHEQQLLAANQEYSIAHMRAALAALESQVALARARVIELYTAEQRRKGEQAKTATWSPAQAFAGKRFTTEAEVDEAFEPEKERLKVLVREGKSIQVV